MLPHKRACNDAVTLGNSTGQLDLPVNVTLTSLADLPLLKVLSYVPGTDLGAVARVCTRLYALTRGHWSVWRGKQACFSFKDHEGLLALLRVTPPSWESLEVCMADPKLRWDHKDIPDPDPKENYNVAKVIEGGRTLSLSLLSETLAVTVIQEFGQRRIKNLSIELHDVRRRDLFFSSLHQATSLETINVKWSWPPSCEGWEPQSYRASSRWPQVLPRLHSVTLDYRGNHHAEFKHECRWLRLLIEAHCEQLRRVSLRSPEVMSLLEFCPSGLERLTVTPVEGMAEKLEPLLQGLRELEFIGRFSSKAGKELAVLLRAWPGPLVSLGLEHFPEEVVRALGSGALAGLKHLRLGDPLEVVAERALSTALPGLPSLTRLVLSAL
ncbi:uncharacterized protein LOC113209522 [Frankliniella occidentalis]|uniref:Uncharacterized protein LOC113209522 n=1 Tax=Frankliniella occidentalis TaxID=133901 RepID=A0A9C6U2C5_FRAOC|nr:uncharacterized protein LOC113209522 [Frankliniella occidentalis]